VYKAIISTNGKVVFMMINSASKRFGSRSLVQKPSSPFAVIKGGNWAPSRKSAVSGVYPYLQMAQLSRGQFWGKRKNTRISTHLKHILNVITLKYNSKISSFKRLPINFRLLFSIIVWTLGIPSINSLNSHRISLSLTAKILTADS